jgi:uncharacterized alpha-E superfamily protein
MGARRERLVLSRVADSIYWTGRYIERAENTARFIDVNLAMTLDAPVTFSDQWAPLVAITGEMASFSKRFETATRDNVIFFLAFDPDNPSSILSCLRTARENARSVRDVLSSEVWEQINRFYLFVTQTAAAGRALRDTYHFLSEVKLLSNLIGGLADNTMSHGEAWHFLQLGRLLERSDNTSRLLDVKYFLLLPSPDDVGSAVDEMQWSILLRSGSALEMYRKRHGRIEPENVVEFLLLDTEFPRSALFCLVNAERSLRGISGGPAGRFQNPAEQQLGRLRSELAYAQVSEIIAEGLHEFLDGYQSKLNAVGAAIESTFFALRPVSGQASGPKRKSRSDVLSGNQSQRRSGGNRGYTSDLGQ